MDDGLTKHLSLTQLSNVMFIFLFEIKFNGFLIVGKAKGIQYTYIPNTIEYNYIWVKWQRKEYGIQDTTILYAIITFIHYLA